MSDQQKLKIKVRDTNETIFEGEIERISSYNEVGPFDVFPMHANFISIIRHELALYHNKEKIKELKIDHAILKVKQDIANIFVGIESLFFDEDNADTLEAENPPAQTDQPQKKSAK